MDRPENFRSLAQMQQWACEHYGPKPLLGTKRGDHYAWIDYASFGREVDQCRAGLAGLGVAAGDKVAVISNNRVEWAVGAYATYGRGAHYVPMYEAQSPDDWVYILRDSGAKVLLCSTQEIHDRVGELFDGIDTLEHVVCFEAPEGADHGFAWLLERGAADPVPPADPGPDDVAGLIYTSGTTGRPKGVVLSHGNFMSNVDAVQTVFPMTEADVSCSFLPWAHSFGQTCELHVLLSRGAAIGLAESAKTLMDDFLLVRPTLLFAVPRIFNRIYDGLRKRMADDNPLVRWMFERGLAVAASRRAQAERGESSLVLDLQYRLLDKLVFSKIRARFGGRLSYVFSGGAALSQEVAEFIDDIGIVVFEGYGLTETSPIATANNPSAHRLGTVGKPIPGVEVFVCNEDREVLPPDTDGEVVVVGPNVMQGYHGLPEATDEVIFELDGRRAFRTGDMGRVTSDGFVKITGRFKEQYKLENGKYVVPTPLEDQLKLSGLIDQVFVFGDNRPFNVCLVVPDFTALGRWAKAQGIHDTSPAALVDDPRAHAKIGEELEEYGAQMRRYERPKRWGLIEEEFTVENGLLTPKMSVKRRLVIEQYAQQLDALYADA